MIDAAAPSSPLVSVLIVNYNSGSNLARCLAALADQTMDDFEVIVVDNGSADRSVASIARAPTALTLDLAGGNLGFAAGINRAAGQARGRWLTAPGSMFSTGRRTVQPAVADLRGRG